MVKNSWMVDNEGTGYSSRIVDLINFIYTQNNTFETFILTYKSEQQNSGS